LLSPNLGDSLAGTITQGKLASSPVIYMKEEIDLNQRLMYLPPIRSTMGEHNISMVVRDLIEYDGTGSDDASSYSQYHHIHREVCIPM